jgi:hypothetical protein
MIAEGVCQLIGAYQAGIADLVLEQRRGGSSVPLQERTEVRRFPAREFRAPVRLQDEDRKNRPRKGGQGMGAMLFAMFLMAGMPRTGPVLSDFCRWKTYSLLPINHPGHRILIVADKKGIVADRTTFPVYGNWCGPGYPKPNSTPLPTDELDAACMHHDQCYAKKGYLSCACDQELLNALERARSRKKDVLRCLDDKGHRSHMPNPFYFWISDFFETSPCKGGCKKTAAGKEVCDTTAARVPGHGGR